MKIFSLISSITFFVILAFSLYLTTVYASSGCCSWHGGQDYCDNNVGKWVCKDGTYSPSCTCGYLELNDFDNIEVDKTSNAKVTELENEIKDLKEKLRTSENNVSDYKTLFWITLICFIGYVFFKKKTS